MAAQIEDLTGRLSIAGASQLTELMNGWVRSVPQSCGAVAASREGNAAEIARTGCEISEIAGVMTEFTACEQGLSTAPYCVLKE